MVGSAPQAAGSFERHCAKDILHDRLQRIWSGGKFGPCSRGPKLSAFRRGLATNLQRLGVPIKIAQRLLRSADFATVANYYVKVVDDAKEAMQRFEALCNERAMRAFEVTKGVVVN